LSTTMKWSARFPSENIGQIFCVGSRQFPHALPSVRTAINASLGIAKKLVPGFVCSCRASAIMLSIVVLRRTCENNIHSN
jgi:hypothetical protein